MGNQGQRHILVFIKTFTLCPCAHIFGKLHLWQSWQGLT